MVLLSTEQVLFKNFEGPLFTVYSINKRTVDSHWSFISFFHSQFPREILEKNLHITALEVLSILVCLRLWGKFFKGQRILVFCDNMAACQVINTGRSRCEILQAFLREICFLAAIFEFEIRAKHLEAVNNRIADHLSRWHFDISHEQSFFSFFLSINTGTIKF